MRRFSGTLVGAALLATLMFTGTAFAGKLPPGVHVDPGSPAGKQYQIPVTGARAETSVGTKTSSASNTSSPPPLFGQGDLSIICQELVLCMW